MWWATLFSGKNGSMVRNVIYSGLIVTFLVIFTLVMVNKAKKAKEAKANKAKIIGYEAEIVPTSLSFSESEYENFAATIDDAIGTFFDDENAIYGVFMKLRTNSDLLKLQETFGVRSAGHDLFTAIRRNLNAEEIQKINTYLSERNISIKI